MYGVVLGTWTLRPISLRDHKSSSRTPMANSIIVNILQWNGSSVQHSTKEVLKGNWFERDDHRASLSNKLADLKLCNCWYGISQKRFKAWMKWFSFVLLIVALTLQTNVNALPQKLPHRILVINCEDIPWEPISFFDMYHEKMSCENDIWSCCNVA